MTTMIEQILATSITRVVKVRNKYERRCRRRHGIRPVLTRCDVMRARPQVPSTPVDLAT